MAQDNRRWQQDRDRDTGAGRGDTRFRGEFDRPRNDGGFNPANEDRTDSSTRGGYGDRGQSGDYTRDNWRQDPLRNDQRSHDGWERWQDARGRWDEGTRRGGEFGRSRDVSSNREFGTVRDDVDQRQYSGSEHRSYGDARYDPYGDAQRRADRHHEPEHREYRAWRDAQVRRLDDEYEAYRRHRQDEFNTHFDAWRRDKYGFDVNRSGYVGQNTHIGATPVEFGGQNANNSGFSTREEITEYTTDPVKAETDKIMK